MGAGDHPTGRRAHGVRLRPTGPWLGHRGPHPSSMSDLAADLFGGNGFPRSTARTSWVSYGGGVVQTAATPRPSGSSPLTLMATTNVAFEAFEGRARSIEQDGMAAQIAPSLVRWFTSTRSPSTTGRALRPRLRSPWRPRTRRRGGGRSPPSTSKASSRALLSHVRVGGRARCLDHAGGHVADRTRHPRRSLCRDAGNSAHADARTARPRRGCSGRVPAERWLVLPSAVGPAAGCTNDR